MKATFLALADQIRTEADAYGYLENLRWPGGPVCPNCHGSDVYLIVPKNGVSRKATNGTMSQRRVWNCRPCRRQFSALTGTMMHGTKAPIRVWLMVIFEMMAAKNGISARKVERKYGVCPRTTWFICHRIRECMKTDGLIASMRGTIVADETFIGGDPSRMNAKTRAKWEHARDTPGSGFAGISGMKTAVVSLINANTGEARSAVIPKVDGTNLRKVISEHVDMAGSVLWTDKGAGYTPIGREFISHATVDHSADEYVGPLGQTTNKAESFFSQLKRSLDGTHHRVSVEHLGRYLSEFDYRFSTKDMTDAERMADMLGRAEGRRLTYKRVTAS